VTTHNFARPFKKNTIVMQRFILAFCTTVLIATALRGQTAAAVPAAGADSTLIDVTIEGMQAGKVRLVGTFGDQNYIADSSMADAGGHFVLRRIHPLPAGYYTFLMPGMKNFSILVDQDQRFTVKAKASDIFLTAEINGSINTQLFFQNMKYQVQQEPVMNGLVDQMRKFPPNTPEYQQAKTQQTALLADRKTHLEDIYKANPNAFFTKFKIAGQNPDFPEFRKPNGNIDTLRQITYFRSHFWDGVDFNDDRLLYTPVVANKLKKYMKDLTPQRPDSLIKVSDEIIRRVMPHKEYFKFFVNWIALQYENGKTTVMDGEAVYVHIIQTYVTPELAFWDKKENIESLRKHAWEMEASLLGKKGPDVRAQNPQGEFKSIYEMTAPIIVVFMFSPDCEHCQKESPEIEAIYEKWKDKGVDFYGIGVNTNDADWKAFVKKNNFTFTNVFDPTNRAIYAKYFVDITPELYVLNKDRIIVGKNLHPNQLEEVFEREFRKMK
jgi:peroxiredoxin